MLDASGLYIKDDAHTFGARGILNVGGVVNGALSSVELVDFFFFIVYLSTLSVSLAFALSAFECVGLRLLSFSWLI